jgi:multiple sugar transport system substrate-binding protein
VKRLLLGALSVLLLVTVSSCSKENSNAEKAPLKIVYKAGYTKWIKDTIEAYEKKYPGRKVKLDLIGGTDADYYTKLSLLLKTDESVDIIFEDSFLLQNMVDSNLLAPLNEITKWKDWEQFYPAFRESATINGNLYGVPISTDVRGLFYNKEIFKKLELPVPWQPKNWQDIINTAKEIKKYGHNIIPFSLNVAAYGEQTTMQTLEMLLYGTESPLYKDGKWVVNSKGLLNSLKFISKIFKEGLGPRLSLVLNKQYNTIIFETTAADQQVAIFLDGCWGMNFWQRKHPQSLNIYGFVPMPTEFGQKPGFISMSGGWLFAVNEKSKKKQEAINFIKFAASKDNYLKYSKIAWELTPRKDVIESPEFPKILKGFANFMEFTHFRPSNGQYPIVSNYIQRMVESVATNNATPEDAMKTFGDNVKRTLGDKNTMELK